MKIRTTTTTLFALAAFAQSATSQTLATYQAKVMSQSPSSYFTFDGGSLTSVAGSGVTLSAAASVASQLNFDVFGNASNSVYFTASGDALYDLNEGTDHLINGGGSATTSSTATGSITLLFRTIDPGPPPSGSASEHFIFSAGGSFTSGNTCALLIENPTSTDPNSIKLRFGDTTTTILQATNVVPDAWYYFALTYNEAPTNANGSPNTNKAIWYLGRLGGAGPLLSGTTISNAVNAVAGDGTDFYIGSQTGFTSGLRNPGDGRVDEFALWSRALSSNEIQAQFNDLPNVALPTRSAYQTVITGQTPSHYFKLDGTPVDAVNGSLVLSTNGSSPLLGYGCDLFADQSGDCYFSAGTDALVAGSNLLNGGGTFTGSPGTGKGSISCLFHPLAGTNYTGQKFVFSAGGSTATENGFALYFENTTSANPLSLKIRFGDSTDVILPVTNFVSEWLYFAMTYDETRTNQQVNWWLARPGTTLQNGLFSAVSGSLAGAGNILCLGNDTNFLGGFRAVNSGRQSNGQLDEFAIWNRVLATNEVTAQFNALVASSTVTLPKLSIAALANKVVLSWPSSTDSGFALQSTTNLVSTNWVGAGSPSMVGTNYVVTNSETVNKQFYRLKK